MQATLVLASGVRAFLNSPERVAEQGAQGSMTAQELAFEVVDGRELANRWKVPPTWVKRRVTDRNDPLPHVKLGRYVRFEWNSPLLTAWWSRRRSGKGSR